MIRISSTVFLMVFASHFTHGQPRGFGDNYLSADFGHLDNDAEFDSVDFMPQFDFDGFFKKVDADERSADTTSLNSFPGNYDIVTEPQQYSQQPIFYTNQRYSEITTPSTSSNSLAPTYEKLKKIMAEKRARLLSDPDDVSYREPIKPLNYSPDMAKEEVSRLSDSLEREVPTYIDSSVRRLDGPFTTFTDDAINESPPTRNKGRKLKVKLRKPVNKRVDTISSTSGIISELPVYNPPPEFNPLFSYENAEERKTTLDFYDEASPQSSLDRTYNFFETPKTRPETSYNRYTTQPQVPRLSDPYQKFPTPRPESTTFNHFSTPPQIPRLSDPFQKVPTPSYVRQDTYKSRQPLVPLEDTTSKIKPRYDYDFPSGFNYDKKDNQPSRENFEPLRKNYEPFKEEYLEPDVRTYKPAIREVQKPKPSIVEAPRVKHNGFYSNVQDDFSTPSDETVKRRQDTGFVERPNFLDQGFAIPSAFKDNLQAPAFADFRPPFGGFSDFLRNIQEDPFISNSRTGSNFFNTPVNLESAVNAAGNSFTNDFSPKTLKTPDETYKFPTLAESPSIKNGFYSNDFIQDYEKSSTTKPSYEPPPVKTTTTVAATTTETYKKPSYNPTKPSYQQPKLEPEYKYKVENYRPPIGDSAEAAPAPTYKIKAAPTPLPAAYKPITTTTLPPSSPSPTYTESSVYYKPAEEETSTYFKPIEDSKYTPGPVYYKPIEESTTAQSPPSDETVATAPKTPKSVQRPPPPKAKKPAQRPRKAPKKPKKSWLSNIRLPSLRRPARKIKAKDQLQPPPPPPPSSVKKSSTELSAKPSNLKPTTAVVKENTNNNNRKKPPPVKKISQRSKKLPRKQHSPLLSAIGKNVEKYKQFFKDRRGGAVAQSTAVLIPYVLSLL